MRRTHFRLKAVAVFVLASVACLACQCGGTTSGSVAPKATIPPTPTSTFTPTPTPTPPPAQVQRSMVEQQGSLQFRLNGVVPADGNFHDTSFLCSQHFVLTKPPTSVTAADLSNISQYLSTHQGAGRKPIVDQVPPSPLPLGWLNGSTGNSPCEVVLRIHNDGTTAILIEGIGIHVDGIPVANANPYPRVDLCTFQPWGISPCNGGGGTNRFCPLTGALQLPTPDGVAGGNTTKVATLDPDYTDTMGAHCTGALAPGGDLAVIVDVIPPVPDSRLLYRVIPFVDTDVGNFTLSKLESTLSYTAASQLQCLGVVTGQNGPQVVPVQDRQIGTVQVGNQTFSGEVLHMCE